MKTNFKVTPIALAIAAAFAASTAFASGDGMDNHHRRDPVSIHKTIDNKMEIATEGRIHVDGHLNVDSSVMAIVNDSQASFGNDVTNQESTNSATFSGNVLNSASGNIGANTAAGDNNQQANAAAISASDASFVFGATDAEAFASQVASHNSTSNMGQTNVAGAGDDVARSAAGNIGLNFAAGNSNQQKNDLAIATGTSRIATATVSAAQMNSNNSTSNNPVHREEVQNTPVSLALSATGGYFGSGFGGYSGSTGGTTSGSQSGTTSGSSYQASNLYPDSWTGASHPSGTSTGHIDIDSQTQGAVQNPARPGVGGLAFDNTGSYSGDQSGTYSGSERGSLGFLEAGVQALSGTVTGNIPVVVVTNLATTNTASLSGNVLASAAGNIGVNVAAGTNNQQFNGLAIAAIHGGAGAGGTTTGGE